MLKKNFTDVVVTQIKNKTKKEKAEALLPD